MYVVVVLFNVTVCHDKVGEHTVNASDIVFELLLYDNGTVEFQIIGVSHRYVYS